jgi:HSP20 family protein
MALIRWEPARITYPRSPVQTEVNRLFNSFFDTPTRTNGSVLRRWIPAVDLVETDDNFVLRADLPGLTESDVNIEVQDNVLTISGERKTDNEERKAGYYRVERSYGSFRRTLTLPEGVDPELVRATFDRGVLEVTVPKPAQLTPRKVQIAVSAASADEPQAIEGTHSPEAAETVSEPSES